MNRLAPLIRQRRISRDLTQREAAERAGLSLSTWQALERTSSSPAGFRTLTLTRAARCLGLSTATVFRAAGHVATGPDDHVGDPDVTDGPDQAISSLNEQLRELHRRDPASFLLVHQQATDTADHLLDIHTES